MKKKILLSLLVLWPIAASVISFAIKADFFVSTILFLGLSSILLSVFNKSSIGKLLIFSLVFGIPVACVVDYIMEAAGGWYVPYSIFDSFRLFGLVTVDLVIWAVLETYFILMFYETFLEKHHKK